MSSAISHFRDLRVYQAAFDLQQQIFRTTKTFPSDERFSLTDQLRRASRSVGANIAEGWQKRRYIAHFVSKLTDADGELAETQHWLDTAKSCGYISTAQHEKISDASIQIGAMLGTMLNTPEKFCPRQSRGIRTEG